MKQKILSIFTAMVMLASLFTGFTTVANSGGVPIEIGDYIQMGTEDGQPILWRCAAFEKIIGEDENGNPIMDSTHTVKAYADGYLPLMIADTVICEKSFDINGSVATGSHGRDIEAREAASAGGSNYWGDSNIRDYFNSDEETVTYTCGNKPSYEHEAGFLTNFTNTEKNAVKSVTHKALLAECDYNALPDNNKKGGSEVYSADAVMTIDNVIKNYSDAYYELVTDKFFLLDVQQLWNMHDNESTLGSDYYKQYKKTDTDYRSYLVMAPRFTTQVLCVDTTSGDISGSTAAFIDRYARPAFYLDPTAEFLQGNGTKATPYSFAVFTKGTGTEASPYEIGDLAVLKKFRDSVNAGEDYADKYIKLTADIDMLNEYSEANGKSWTPIGTSTSSGLANKVFAGTFDGNGHTINGLYIGSAKDASLFLHTGADAVIKNLSVSGTISITGDAAAGICVSNQGEIQNCTFKGSVDGANHLGGICAYNYGTVSRCINSGEVVGTGSYIGGLCGDNRKTIENCYNVTPISGGEMTGGICGLNYSTDTSVKNCYNVGMISDGENTGGVCGKNDNPTGVLACYYLDGRCAVGNGGYTDGATALQLLAFNTSSSFSGWDFDNVWKIEESHPVLRGVAEPEILMYVFDKGYGTKTSPYEISSLSKLEAFRDTVNRGTYDYRGKYIKLTADIDMSDAYNAANGKSWTSIGILSKRFNGNFSGGGHTISGLYQHAASSADMLGLFGYNEGGLIEKLTVSGSVSAPADTAAVAGGICGQNRGGTIRECVNQCDVTGKGTAQIGGVCGYLDNNAKIERCYNTGSVSGDLAYTGGILGNNQSGSVKNCYNTGAISGGSGSITKTGGVCGYVKDNTENSYNYNYGTVSFGHAASGTNGVYGGVDADSVQNCYYNTDAYAVTHAAMGKTAEEFKLQETFDGWDFDNVWEMSEIHGRPILKAIPEPAPPHEHDMSVECGDSNEITFAKALTSKDGKLYIDGAAVEPDGWDEPGDSYWYTELPEGNYYLEDDIELANDISVYETVNLCLNGHTLNMGENSIGIYERSATVKGVLNICDCGKNGVITGTHHSDPAFNAKIVSNGEFSLYGGKVINTSDNADAKKQAISTYEGTIKIFGGEVVSLNDNAVCISPGDTLILSGAPKISGAADKADIYIDNDSAGAGIEIDAPLTIKTPYRVAAAKNNIFTFGWTTHMEDKNFSDYFISAAKDKSINKNGSELEICDYAVIEQPSPSPSASPSASPSPNPSASPSASPSPSPSVLPSASPSPSVSPSQSPTPTATPNTDENAECIKITAIYSNNGALISVTIEKVKVSEITPEQNTQTQKIFYWESLESMKPICLPD